MKLVFITNKIKFRFKKKKNIIMNRSKLSWTINDLIQHFSDLSVYLLGGTFRSYVSEQFHVPASEYV